MYLLSFIDCLIACFLIYKSVSSHFKFWIRERLSNNATCHLFTSADVWIYRVAAFHHFFSAYFVKFRVTRVSSKLP